MNYIIQTKQQPYAENEYIKAQQNAKGGWYAQLWPQ